jgi:hypothetical protein
MYHKTSLISYTLNSLSTIKRNQKIRRTYWSILAGFALYVLSAASVKAQDVFIVSDGQTGTSGSGWSISGDTLKFTGGARIQASVIENALANGPLILVPTNPWWGLSFTLFLKQDIISSSEYPLQIGVKGKEFNRIDAEYLLQNGGKISIHARGLNFNRVDATISTTLSGSDIDINIMENLDMNVFPSGKGYIKTTDGKIEITLDTDSDNKSNFWLDGLNIVSQTGDVTIKAYGLNTNDGVISTAGKVTIEPTTSSFAGPTAPTTNFTIAPIATRLTIGKPGDTSNIRFTQATTISGPVSVYGNTIEIDAALTATDSDITLVANTSVTQTKAITADGLALMGAGTFTLTNFSNNIKTIAGGSSATKLASLSLVDATGGLTIGSINPDGITASGPINIETLTGDITLSKNVSTDNTTSNAITINAGKNSAVYIGSGGDIKVSGTPTLTTGAGGIVKLFSGSSEQSTGLTALVGGSGNTRLGVDETSTINPALLPDNQYALYRVLEAPSAPTDLEATPGDGQVVITFEAPTSNGGGAIVNYEYKLDDGETWIAFNPADDTSPVTISGLTNGTEYVIQLRASNISTKGEASAEVKATPRTVPGAPTITDITPGNGTASVAFTAPDSDGGSVITDYEYLLVGQDIWTTLGTSSPAIITGLVNGIEYTVQVRAVNAAGGSLGSNMVNVTPRTVPGAPTDVIAQVNGTDVSLNWTEPTSNGGAVITSYTVTSNPEGKTCEVADSGNEVTAAGCTITSLTRGTTYSFTVIASNVAGDSEPSAPSQPAIIQLLQNITFNPITNKTWGDDDFELGPATTDAGLTVTFSAADPSIVEISGNMAKLLKAGTTSINAIQPGNSQYAAANSVQHTITVLKAEQAISINPVGTKTFGEPSFELSPTFSSAGLPLTFISSNPDIVSIEGNSATIRKAGIVDIAVNQEGDDRYLPAPEFVFSLTVGKSQVIVTPLPNQGKDYGTQDPLIAYTIKGLKYDHDGSVMTGTLSREAGEQPGIYSIRQGSIDLNPDFQDMYMFELAEGIFEIRAVDSDVDGVPDHVEDQDGTDKVDPYSYKDSDRDGVPDYVEGIDSTDPLDGNSNLDPDGDRVPSYIEIREGTDPADALSYRDTDGDLVPDQIEKRDGTDWADITSFKDSDRGGVPDYVEAFYFTNRGWPQTDPNNAADDNRDSDGDWVSDYHELLDGSEPYDLLSYLDTDADGVPNQVEKIDGTDPNDALSYRDSDADHVPDYIEVRIGSDSRNARSYPDIDGDLVPDYIEARDGTNPADATSFKDTDRGGVPDYVERTLYGLYGLASGDPSNPGDDARDSDGDGVGDYAELKEATDPSNDQEYGFTRGTGSCVAPYDPYIVESLYHVSLVRRQPDKCYLQDRYINASAAANFNHGRGFTPIGIEGPAFSGGYDGAGYRIGGLVIATVGSQMDQLDNAPGAALFAKVMGSPERPAVIRNVHLDSVQVAGTSNVGALVGYGQWVTLTEVSSTGSVTASGQRAGGLVGHGRNVTIERSYSSATVTGSAEWKGGLAGALRDARMDNSYFAGSMGAGPRSAGLVAYLERSTLINTYSAMRVVAGGATNAIPAGITAEAQASTATGTFWDVTASNASSSALGQLATTAQMMDRGMYTGWDFTNIWDIATGDILSYPYLRSNQPREFSSLRPAAYIQVIHNMASGEVSVMIDGVTRLENLVPEGATPYMAIPSGVAFQLRLVSKSSGKVILDYGNSPLRAGDSYLIFATGGEDNAQIITYNDTEINSVGPNQVGVVFMHGTSPYKELDLDYISKSASVTTIRNIALGIDQGSKSGLITLEYTPSKSFRLSSMGSVLGEFTFFLEGLEGQAFKIVAMGGNGVAKQVGGVTVVAVTADGRVIGAQLGTSLNEEELPSGFALHGNFPNPFNPSTNIRFDLPQSAEVTVQVVDILGRVVMSHRAGALGAGANRTVALDASRLASGVYLYRIIAAGASQTFTGSGRFTLVK